MLMTESILIDPTKFSEPEDIEEEFVK